MNDQSLEKQAFQCLQNGHYAQAIALYEQCVNIDSYEMINYWYLGVAYLLKGEEEAAQNIWMSAFLAGTPEEIENWSEALKELLEKIAIEKFKNGQIFLAKKVYLTLQSFDSNYQNNYLETNFQVILDQWFKEGCSLAIYQNYSSAIEKFQQVLNLDDRHHQTWYHLAMIDCSLNQYESAYQALVNALEIDATSGLYYYSLGVILEHLHEINEAIKAYQKALEIDSSLVDAYNNLGNIFKNNNQLEIAELIYSQSIDANPEHFGSYLNLGNVLIARNQLNEGINIYYKALNLKPNNSDVFYNLGFAFELQNNLEKSALYYGYSYYYQGEYEKAISDFQEFLKTQQGNEFFYITLGDCYKRLKQLEEAIKIYQAGINLYPENEPLYNLLILLYRDCHQLQEGNYLANKAAQKFPKNVCFHPFSQALLPVIYETSEEINFYRERHDQYLDTLTKNLALENEEARKKNLKNLDFMSNSILAYQNKNDRKMNQKFGNFVYEISKSNYHNLVQKLSFSPLNLKCKIRVGYFCRSLETLGKLHINWFKYANRDTLEMYCYTLAGQPGNLTQQFQLYSDNFRYLPNHIESASEQILYDHLDFLIYSDIGVEPFITQLASLRLSPIQCAAWGFPSTSGLPTIDYFLSSDAMEPSNAEEHYSETLIRLPNLGISYPKIELPKVTKKRTDFDLSEEAVIYLSCQNLSKYLPQHDYLFPSIAQQVNNAKFIFFNSYQTSHITEQFRRRLKQIFRQYDLDAEQFCHFLPMLEWEDYLNLNLLSDVFLDTLGWSGGFTTLDAIACHLPIVTYPGELMRGRQSYGMLKIIDVTETIAQDEAEYIEIAVKLGLDSEWRQKIRQKMQENHACLYDDKTCVVALEEFYQQAIESSSTNTVS